MIHETAAVHCTGLPSLPVEGDADADPGPEPEYIDLPSLSDELDIVVVVLASLDSEAEFTRFMITDASSATWRLDVEAEWSLTGVFTSERDWDRSVSSS